MPNIGKAIKDEIVRLARKECKSDTASLRKSTIAARKVIVTLKRQMAALEKQVKELQNRVPVAATVAPEAPEGAKARITAKGLRSLRKSLRMTGEQFSRLLGVSTQAVYAWERKEGPIRLRTTTKAAVLSVRGLGAREARARLAEKAQAKKPAAKKAPKVKKAKGKKRAAK